MANLKDFSDLVYKETLNMYDEIKDKYKNDISNLSRDEAHIFIRNKIETIIGGSAQIERAIDTLFDDDREEFYEFVLNDAKDYLYDRYADYNYENPRSDSELGKYDKVILKLINELIKATDNYKGLLSDLYEKYRTIAIKYNYEDLAQYYLDKQKIVKNYETSKIEEPKEFEDEFEYDLEATEAYQGALVSNKNSKYLFFSKIKNLIITGDYVKASQLLSSDEGVLYEESDLFENLVYELKSCKRLFEGHDNINYILVDICKDHGFDDIAEAIETSINKKIIKLD